MKNQVLSKSKAKPTKAILSGFSKTLNNSSLSELLQIIQAHSNPVKAKELQRFFKTGPGQYAEGDLFHGIIVPQQRLIAKQFSHLDFSDLQTLLNSPFHEERLIGLFILTNKFILAQKQQDTITLQRIIDFYLNNTKNINNWDLVDLSAYKILGKFLFNKPRQILYQLVLSKNLWERRISIISTMYFVKNNDFDDALKLSSILISDHHDLIHKAVGWILREIGKVNRPVLNQYLQENYQKMPRTSLRYAIEHYPENIRQKYLKNQF